MTSKGRDTKADDLLLEMVTSGRYNLFQFSTEKGNRIKPYSRDHRDSTKSWDFGHLMLEFIDMYR